MAGTDRTESPPVESRAGAAETTEAFGLLADETRLGILLALWEAYDPYAEEPVSFSRLFDGVDYDDRGNFNYHLRKLEGRFVRKDPEGGGYKLTDPGLTLVQVVIAGFDVEDATIPPTEIDQPCVLCGEPMAVGYRHRHVYWRCTECRGIVPDDAEVEGFLGAVQLDPAGVVDRTPEAVKAASRVAILRREGSFFDGLCPTCSGPVDARLEPCPDHEPDPICETCERRFSTRAYFQCRVCKDHTSTSPMSLALGHPAVIAFYETRGVSMRFTADDFASGAAIESRLADFSMTVVTADPPRVEVTATTDGEAVRLAFDETVSVVDVQRPSPPDH